MKLALHYQKQAIQTANAFLIQGDLLEYWLEQLTTYEIDLQDVFCYVLPTSISEPKSSGLFVVLKEEKPANLFSFAYQKIGDKLFIPTNASIFPMLSEVELNQLLLWDIQVFHPSIGLVGFEKEQTYDFEEALVFLPNQTTLWSFAQEGIKPPMDLMKIRVEQKPEEEQLDNLKDFVEKEIGGKKPIEELKEEKKEEGFLKELKEKTKEKLLKGTQNILNSWKEKSQENQSPINNDNQPVNEQNHSESDLSKILSAIFGMLAFIPSATSVLSDYNKSNTYEEKQSLLKKLDNWVNQQIDDIEAKRKNEINRLLDLFDENSDEALQYALPLDSPYADRGEIGEQERSAELSKNNTDFRLGGLQGGGKSSDSWNLENEHYQQLRQKYENAANQAIEKKDFRKAAYIYAHLLADFQKAANVLEQGNFYHEAVAIYKKHLNNLKAAAQCYERGGMLLEAIDLYKDFDEDEKIGDLYSVLNQQKNAKGYYDKCVNAAITKRDYREAYRLQKNKLKDRSESKEILLKAWEVKAQEEYCLREYFLLEIEDNQEAVPEIIETFYKGLEEREKITYLHVLDNVLKKHKEEEFVLSTQKIAYEIISKEISKNNINHFPLFNKFIPNDPLLFTDCSRFTKNFKPSISKKEESYQEIFQLGSSHDEIDWFHIIHDNFTFIVFGLDENKQLVKIRSTIHGEQTKHVTTDFYTPSNKFINKEDVFFQSQLELSNTITLIGKNHYQPFRKSIFEKGEIFSNDLIVQNTGDFLPNRILSLLVLPYEGEMCTVFFSMEQLFEIQIEYYTISEDKLLHSQVFFIENQELLEQIYDKISIREFSKSQEMVLLGTDKFVALFGNQRHFLIEIYEGKCTVQFIKQPIVQMILFSKHELLLVSKNNIFLYQEDEVYNLYESFNFECEENIISAQKLITKEVVVLFEKEFIILGLVEEESKLVVISKTILKEKVVQILPTNQQGKYCFLEASGKVVFYKV